jgi:NADH dehydrogenase
MGSMATIGRAAAIAQFRNWKFSGFFAWLMWLFVHLMNIVQFENRLLIFFQWSWNYLTYERTARLITGSEGHPSLEKKPEGREQLTGNSLRP